MTIWLIICHFFTTSMPLGQSFAPSPNRFLFTKTVKMTRIAFNKPSVAGHPRGWKEDIQAFVDTENLKSL